MDEPVATEVSNVSQLTPNPKHAEAAGKVISLLAKCTDQGLDCQMVIAMALTYMIDCYDWDAEAVTRCLARNVRVFNTNQELQQVVLSIIAQEIQRDKALISIPSEQFSQNYKGSH